MAIALIQEFGATETATATSLQAIGTTSTGSTLVLCLHMRKTAASVTSVVDSAGNVWTKIPGAFTDASPYYGEMWWCGNANAITQVTVNCSPASGLALSVLEISGMGSAPTVDVAATASGASTTPSVAAAGPTTTPVEFVVGMIGIAAWNTPTGVTAEWTELPVHQSVVTAKCSVIAYYQVTSSTSIPALTGTLSGSLSWIANIVTLIPSGGGGPTVGTGAQTSTISGTAAGTVQSAQSAHLVQSVVRAANTIASPTATLAATTAGNLLTATVSVSLTAGTGTITPPVGWLAGTMAFDGGHRIIQQFIYPNNPGGITAVTFTVAGAGLPQTGYGVVLSEFSGVPTNLTVLDTVASGQAVSSVAVTTLTATAAGSTTSLSEFELCSARNSSPNTAEALSTPTGFALAASQPNGSLGNVVYQWYRQTTTTETPTATTSWSDAVAADLIIDTWRVAATPGTGSQTSSFTSTAAGTVSGLAMGTGTEASTFTGQAIGVVNDVGNTGTRTFTFTSLATATWLATSVSVVAFSDIHVDDPVSQAQIDQIGALIAAQSPVAVLFTGDMSTNWLGTGIDNVGVFDTGLSASAGKIRPSEGNHDMTEGGGVTGKWGNYWRVQEGLSALIPATEPTCYSFDIPGSNWHVVNLEGLPLDGGPSVASGSAQYNWLLADLQAHANKHIIAMWHEPAFGYSNYTGSAVNNQVIAPAAQYANNLAGWAAIRSLLAQYHCELEIHGHHHYYARYRRFNNTPAVDAAYPVAVALGFAGGDTNNSHSYGPPVGYSGSGPPYPLVDPTCGTAWNGRGGGSPDNNTSNIVVFTLRDTGFDVLYVGNGGSFADSATYTLLGPLGAGTGAWGISFTATATGTWLYSDYGVGVQTAAVTSIAVGLVVDSGNTGALAVGFTPSATGVWVPASPGAAAWGTTLQGTATGGVADPGTGAIVVAISGLAVGAVRVPATASLGVGVTTQGVEVGSVAGSAAPLVSVTSSAVGVVIVRAQGTFAAQGAFSGTGATGAIGIATGTVGVTTQALGVQGRPGTALATAGYTGQATGAIRAPASATLLAGYSALAVGLVVDPNNTGQQDTTFAALAVGSHYGGGTYSAQATETAAFAGLAVASLVRVPAQATGGAAFTGQATGLLVRNGTAQCTSSVVATASATVRVAGTGGSTVSITGVAVGVVLVPASAALVIGATGSGMGASFTARVGTGTLTVGVVALGSAGDTQAAVSSRTSTFTSLAVGTWLLSLHPTAAAGVGFTSRAVGRVAYQASGTLVMAATTRAQGSRSIAATGDLVIEVETAAKGVGRGVPISVTFFKGVPRACAFVGVARATQFQAVKPADPAPATLAEFAAVARTTSFKGVH